MIVGCNKKDLISPTYEGLSRVDNQVLVNRFLHESPSTSEKARQIIADIKKTEAKHPFLAEYARRYGFPEWEYMFGTSISPGNRQAQKGIDFSNQVVVNSSSTANKSSGFYFIPLKDSITKRVKAYIYCQQYNDSTFTYTTYDVEKIVAFTPPNDTAKVNKHITLAVASYFEKQINGIEITNEFKNGIYKNVRIKEVTGQSTSQNAIGLQGGIESNAHPVSSCYHVNIYVIEFSGWPIFLVFKTPCLPEVVVVANPNPSSGGSSNGGSFFSGIMTPPSFTPPSLGGGGTGGGSGSGYTPPPYSSYTPPPNWFDWNFLFQNPSYWSVADPSMLPIGIIYTPIEIFNSMLSAQQSYYWNNPVNNEFKAILINFLNFNNYSLESKNYVISLIDLLLTDPTLSLEQLENYFLNKNEEVDGSYDASFWDNQIVNSPFEPLPSLIDFYNAFPKVILNGKIYKMESRDVFSLVGGNMDVQNKLGNPSYQNACAIRGSMGLNYSNKEIQNGINGTEKGTDGKNYILSAKAFNKYMNKTFGPPPSTHRLTKMDINGNPKKISDFLKGKNGIYSMVISGKNYSGHIDLILNGIVIGGTAIGLSDVSKVDYIEIWPLN